MPNLDRFLRLVSFALLAGVGLVVLSHLSSVVLAAAPMQMPGTPQEPPMPQAPPMPSMPQAPSMPQISQPQMPSMPQGPSTDGSQGASFLGAWCAQGDPSKQASISGGGMMLNLTNENGDTSIGNMRGANQIIAPQWQMVTGTLSGDGSRINWSNGTFWARCNNGGGGHGLNLSGNWYPQGNRSLKCSIQQRRGSLTLQNESGQKASGSFSGKWQVTTNWQGTKITGNVSRDGNRIDWSNGTYWIRYRLYGQ